VGGEEEREEREDPRRVWDVHAWHLLTSRTQSAVAKQNGLNPVSQSVRCVSKVLEGSRARCSAVVCGEIRATLPPVPQVPAQHAKCFHSRATAILIIKGKNVPLSLSKGQNTRINRRNVCLAVRIR